MVIHSVVFIYQLFRTDTQNHTFVAPLSQQATNSGLK
jgi:hypothetical protein